MLTLVVDTNIVFSAILKPGKLRSLLFNVSLKLYAPTELAEELDYLKPRIEMYTELSGREVNLIVGTILKDVISIVPRNEYLPIARKIYPIVSRVDPKDTPFVALASYLGVPLWTGDKGILGLAVDTGFKHFKAIDTRGVEMLLEDREWGEVMNYLVGRFGGVL